MTPAVSDARHRPPAELTWRGAVLGVAVTLLFTGANLYLGLKIGLTFATSIPAAVIAMALLRGFRDSSILENNIVQTVASAAGTLSSIGFVLPGLVMTGWWAGFDFWTTFWVCATGGLTGVIFSVPLRRALVTGSDLPFPEGVAAAAVLAAGTGEGQGDGAAESRRGLRALVVGSIAAAAYALVAATGLVSGQVTRWFRAGPVGSGVDAILSLALVGAGHLVGLAIGVAMGVGLVIGYGVATPFLTWLHGTPDAAQQVWSGEVRFFGSGVIGAAALWTLGQLAVPIARGLAAAAAAGRARGASVALPVEERDIAPRWLALGLAALLVPVAVLLHRFAAAGPLAPVATPLAIAGTAYVVVAGALVAAVCGYMAGLIGASNSPVSGLGILGIVGAGLLLAGFAKPHVAPAAVPHLVALALFWTAIIFSTATIANDNLQDLKTGQLVGATPWRQQVALMIGVLAGSVTVPVVLQLLNRAYGFAPLAGVAAAGPAHPLAAPQATLIATLARGVLGAGLDWWMIGAGGLTGAALIALDAALGRAGRRRLAPLAVGLGIYLPMGVTLPVVVGAVLGHRWERAHPGEAAHRLGVMLASGFIVGDGLMGVLVAGVIVAAGSDAPLALVGPGFANAGVALGLAVFAALLWGLYRWAGRLATPSSPASR